jgi:hypothetical protein
VRAALYAAAHRGAARIAPENTLAAEEPGPHRFENAARATLAITM